MRIYGHPQTRSTRVTWTAEEAAAEYEFVRVELGSGAHRQPPFTDLNPAGKIPLMVDGDLVLSESAAICNHIGARARDTELVPRSDSARRGEYDRWCFFAIGELEQPLWTIAKHSFVLPKRLRVRGVRDTARWEFEQAARVLSIGLGDRAYLLGERFTVADILVGHTLAWATYAKLGLAHDNLIDYARRVLSREALKRARERESAA